MAINKGARTVLFFLAVVLTSNPARSQTIVRGWELPEGMATFSLDVGDIDGDTNLDIYTADFESLDKLWLNDGSGGFSDSGQVLDGGRGSKALLATIDSDVYLDLWISRHLSSISVWTGNSLGELTDSGQTIGPNVAQRGAALGDLDGDGDLDAVAPTDTSSEMNRVFLNDGTGVFTDSGQDLGSFYSRAAALAEVDGDADLDIMFGNNGTNKLWLNDGSGNFTDAGSVGSGGTFDVGFCDVDDDNDQDAFFVNGRNGGEANKVFFNDGNGNFTDSGQSLGSAYDFATVLEDFDGDGDCDAYVVGHVTWGDTLWLNDGSGQFSHSATFGEGGGIDVRAGAMNGATHLDVVVANRYQPDTIWLGDGAGNFANSGVLLGSSAGTEVALGDIDGDGDLDALTGNLGAVGRVLLNDGSGNFTDSNQWLNADYAHSISALCLADLDGDADLDAFLGLTATGGGATKDNRVWWNDGAGNFTDSGQRQGSSASSSVVCADMDGDTDLDLMVGNSLTANELWRNDGSGSFSLDPQALGAGNTWAIAVEDLNADSFPDLVVTNLGTEDTVWFNDGTGIFTDSGQLLGSTSLKTTSIHLDDIDYDGDLDAWVINGNGSTARNEVWLNDGTGTFADSGLSLADSSSNGSAIGNVDGDAEDRNDVFVVNFYGDHRVWLNQSLSSRFFADGFESGDVGAWSSSSP